MKDFNDDFKRMRPGMIFAERALSRTVQVEKVEGYRVITTALSGRGAGQSRSFWISNLLDERFWVAVWGPDDFIETEDGNS